MYAGGDPKIDQVTKAASKYLCGPESSSDWGLQDPAQKTTCQGQVAAKVNYAFGQVTDEGQRNLLRALLTGWYANPYDKCFGNLPTNDAACYAETFAGTRPLIFQDFNGRLERRAFDTDGDANNDYVSWAIAQVRSGHGAEAVALVASSKALEALTKDLDPNQAKAARRLYNQAIADPDVDPVKFDKLADYAKALEAIATQINGFARMPNVDKLYVKDVVPGAKPEDAPTTNAIEAPAELYDPEKLGFAKGDALPPEAVEQLTRLFYEARESYKKQTKTANKDVPEATVTADAAQTAAAVKEKVAAAKTKIADLAALLNPFTASAQVKDKTIEKVVLSDGAVAGVPAALIAGVNGARENGYLQTAIAEFWADEVAGTYATLKPEAQGKVVAELVKQFNAYDSFGSDASPEIARAHRIALTRAVSIGDDGAVKLEEAPWLLSARVKDDWRNIAVYRKLKKLYEAAIAADKGKYEGDGKEIARKNLANAIAARAEQFVLYENYADLPVDTRDYSGELKGRDTIPGMVEFMTVRFIGFDDKGGVKPFFAHPLTSTTVSAPVFGDKPATLSLGLDGLAGGVVAGDAARNDGGLLWADVSLQWDHQVSSLFRYGAGLTFMFAKFPEMLAPAGDADAFNLEEGNAIETYRIKELWGMVGFTPIPELDLALKAGIINKRGKSNGYGLEDSVLWYGMDPTLGGSRGLGVRVDPKVTLLEKRLTLFGDVGVASYSGGIDFRNKALDEDGDGSPDGEEHAYARGGTVLFGSAGLDYTIIKDWWRSGVRYTGSTVLGADEADPTSGYGKTLHSLDLGTGVLFGGSGHALDANARLTWAGDERREDSFQYTLALHYQGPDYEMAPWALFQPIAMVSHTDKEATVRSGEDLYGGGSTCTGLSCAGGAGDTSTPGGPIFDILTGNGGEEISVKPKIKFRPGPEWLDGFYLQPTLSAFWSGQGSADGTNSRDLGFFVGLGFGIGIK